MSDLLDFGALPQIPEEETRHLLAQWQDHGDQAARERLLRTNIPYIVTAAQRWRSDALSLAAGVNAGATGLLLAADRYDLQRPDPVRFLSFARWHIEKAIRAAANEASGRIVRLSTCSQRARQLLQQALEDTEGRWGHHVPERDVAEQLDLPDEYLQSDVWWHGGYCLSLERDDAPCHAGGGGRPLREVVADSTETPLDALIGQEHLLLARRLGAMVHNLPELERTILTAHYGLDGADPQPLYVVAQTLGIGRMWCRTLRDRALAILRRCAGADTADTF